MWKRYNFTMLHYLGTVVKKARWHIHRYSQIQKNKPSFYQLDQAGIGNVQQHRCISQKSNNIDYLVLQWPHVPISLKLYPCRPVKFLLTSAPVHIYGCVPELWPICQKSCIFQNTCEKHCTGILSLNKLHSRCCCWDGLHLWAPHQETSGRFALQSWVNQTGGHCIPLPT